MTTPTLQSGSFTQILADLKQQVSIKVLSLDCFDTLFWRLLNSPSEVFALNADTVNSYDRVKAESLARQRQKMLQKGSEPSLEEIYAEHVGADDQAAAHMAQQEVRAEIQIGVVFEPALQALRYAKSCGWRTIIVSDTYYSSEQLRQILTAVYPEITNLIDAIYCSSEHGAAKANGLWPKVLNAESVTATEIYHIGDNELADFHSPVKLGVNARHLIQNPPAVQSLLSIRNAPARILLQSSEKERAVPSLYHAWTGQYCPEQMPPEQLVGYTFLGQILTSFSAWLKDSVQQLKQEGASVKIAYLFRDGYMLQQACAALDPDLSGSEVRISRFSSWAASFDSEESVLQYLIRFNLRGMPANKIMHQLLLTDKTQRTILARIQAHPNPEDRLGLEIQRPEVIKEILTRSAEYRRRLFAYLQRQLSLEAGDTLLLVDVGYEGTTQHRLQHLIAKAFEVQVKGRYVLSLPNVKGADDRKGMIDDSLVDLKGLHTLTRFIAAFELLISSHDQTVVSYTKDGEPVTESSPMPESTLETIQKVQRHALEFVASWKNQHYAHRISQEQYRLQGAIDLARFIYFPTPEEIDLLSQLRFDINLGIQEQTGVVDIERGLQTMRKRGASMLTNNQTLSMRTNFPAELRHDSIDYAISLMASQRHGISYSYDQVTHREIPVPVMYPSRERTVQTIIRARATHDGYYSLLAPDLQSDFVILLGKSFGLVQIDSVSAIATQALYSELEERYTQTMELGRNYLIDGGRQIQGNVYALESSGFIYIPKQAASERLTFNIVFRPLADQLTAQPDPAHLSQADTMGA